MKSQLSLSLKVIPPSLPALLLALPLTLLLACDSGNGSSSGSGSGSSSGSGSKAPSAKPSTESPTQSAPPQPYAARLVSGDEVPQGLAAITAEGILQGVQVLSSDDMEGRGTGTPGEAKAAEWIAEQYREIGLKPLGNDYFQDVILIGYNKKAAASTLTLNGPNGDIPYTAAENLTYWSTSQKPVVDLAKAPLVFVGYGVEAPEVEWDDFKGFDVKGKVLVFLNNDPPVEENGSALFGGEARTYYGRWTYKFEQAMRHGAAGAVMIHTEHSAGYGWQVVSDSGEHESFALNLPGSGYQVDFLAWIHQDLAGQLAATVGSDLDGWFEQAGQRDFKPVELPVTLDTHIETDLRKAASRNVVGIIKGSDPTLSEQTIVFSAHYDHLGKGKGKGDQIFNGAWDNGAGTSAMIALARGIAASEVQPKRSIAFLAAAAEEKGSLGSLWFVKKPPIPLHHVVANLNVDMPQIFGVTRDIAAIGKVTNTLGDVLIDVAAAYGVDGTPIEITGDPRPNAGSFYRSDQVNFAKAGIPALFLNPGGDYVGEISIVPSEYRDAHYHQASDEISEAWDLSGCERDMRVLMLTALSVANTPPMPRWADGNEFEGQWRALHGKK